MESPAEKLLPTDTLEAVVKAETGRRWLLASELWYKLCSVWGSWLKRAISECGVVSQQQQQQRSPYIHNSTGGTKRFKVSHF